MSPELSAWFAAGSYFDYRGHGAWYRYTNQKKKQTVVLIHGFPTASFDFAPIWSQLSEHYNLLTCDMLGFGFSAKPAGYAYSVIDQARLVAALAQSLNLGKYHVLAHDYGVSVAQELLAEQGGKSAPVLSVCFLNGGLYPEHHKPLLVQKLMLSPLGPLLAQFFTKAKLRASFDSIFGYRKATEAELEDFWQLIEYNDGRRVIPKLLHYMNERKLYRERWVTAMETAAVPLSMINGPLDPISGRHLAEAFAQRNPGARVEILEGVGHYPQVEAPERVAGLYQEILGKQASPE